MASSLKAKLNRLKNAAEPRPEPSVPRLMEHAAQAVAEALHADRLVFLTDVGGILIDSHNSKTAVAHLDVARAEELMEAGLIAGGMAPKVKGCIHAIRGGVGEVSILDGRAEHVLLLDVLHERVTGTCFTK